MSGATMRTMAALATAAWALGGCALSAADIDTGVGEPEPTWEADIAPLMAQHCVRCHGEDGRLEDGVDLSTYAAARAARVTSACTAITDPVVEAFADDLVPRGGTADGPCDGIDVFSMPLGASAHMGLDEQVTFARWVSQGAVER
jgi:hypothetical protein